MFIVVCAFKMALGGEWPGSNVVVNKAAALWQMVIVWGSNPETCETSNNAELQTTIALPDPNPCRSISVVRSHPSKRYNLEADQFWGTLMTSILVNIEIRHNWLPATTSSPGRRQPAGVCHRATGWSRARRSRGPWGPPVGHDPEVSGKWGVIATTAQSICI